MVRLLRPRNPRKGNLILRFQSHNGAIAARKRKSQSQSAKSFQSHNGAIAAKAVLIRLASTPASFNPTMVRLLHHHPEREALLKTFQSHNGAIAAAKALNRTLSLMPCFNPTMVRLLHAELHLSPV